jgi:hypothetical protein
MFVTQYEYVPVPVISYTFKTRYPVSISYAATYPLK